MSACCVMIMLQPMQVDTVCPRLCPIGVVCGLLAAFRMYMRSGLRFTRWSSAGLGHIAACGPL